MSPPDLVPKKSHMTFLTLSFWAGGSKCLRSSWAKQWRSFDPLLQHLEGSYPGKPPSSHLTRTRGIKRFLLHVVSHWDLGDVFTEANKHYLSILSSSETDCPAFLSIMTPFQQLSFLLKLARVQLCCFQPQSWMDPPPVIIERAR